MSEHTTAGDTAGAPSDNHQPDTDIAGAPAGGQRADGVANAHRWFEHNSGWAPPDVETLEEWIADGVCRCPDECLVAPRGTCAHGLASWLTILQDLDEPAGRDGR